jgi:hypothetical protein
MRVVAFLSAIILSLTAASGQGPTPAAAPKPSAEPSAYCRSGAQAIFSSSGEAELANLQQVCRRGDIIAVSTAGQGSVFAIGRLCDFSKSIINAGGFVLCSLTATRPLR